MLTLHSIISQVNKFEIFFVMKLLLTLTKIIKKFVNSKTYHLYSEIFQNVNSLSQQSLKRIKANSKRVPTKFFILFITSLLFYKRLICD